jgi:hypothetical protein
LLMATARALYDVIGIVTTAQAHLAEAVLRRHPAPAVAGFTAASTAARTG